MEILGLSDFIHLISGFSCFILGLLEIKLGHLLSSMCLLKVDDFRSSLARIGFVRLIHHLIFCFMEGLVFQDFRCDLMFTDLCFKCFIR